MLKISYDGVRYTLKCLNETGFAQDNRRPGRPRGTSPKQDKYLRLLSLQDRRKSSQQLTNEMRAGLNVNNPSSIARRRLIAAGPCDRVAAKKPLLRSQNNVKRLTFSRQHQYWLIEQWNRVF